MKILNKLPLEIVDLIQGYKGEQKLRNGKYMGQIPKNDPRYEIFDNALIFVVYRENQNGVKMHQNIQLFYIHPATKREISIIPSFSLIHKHLFL